MADLDNDTEIGEDTELPVKKKIDRKKVLIFLLPALIVIGIAVGLFFTFNHSSGPVDKGNYSVVTRPGATADAAAEVIVFYDLPEITANVRNEDGTIEQAKMKINLELSSVNDVLTVDGYTPKLVDAIIAHTSELSRNEISGSSGLYWLKEELLYRINLIVSPIKVNNVNFKNFEIKNAKEGK